MCLYVCGACPCVFVCILKCVIYRRGCVISRWVQILMPFCVESLNISIWVLWNSHLFNYMRTLFIHFVWIKKRYAPDKIPSPHHINLSPDSLDRASGTVSPQPSGCPQPAQARIQVRTRISCLRRWLTHSTSGTKRGSVLLKPLLGVGPRWLRRRLAVASLRCFLCSD